MSRLLELFLVHLHGIHDIIGGYDWKFPRSPSEIQNPFEFAWSLYRRSYCSVLYIPRVRDVMHLGEPV